MEDESIMWVDALLCKIPGGIASMCISHIGRNMTECVTEALDMSLTWLRRRAQLRLSEIPVY